MGFSIDWEKRGLPFPFPAGKFMFGTTNEIPGYHSGTSDFRANLNVLYVAAGRILGNFYTGERRRRRRRPWTTRRQLIRPHYELHIGHVCSRRFSNAISSICLLCYAATCPSHPRCLLRACISRAISINRDRQQKSPRRDVIKGRKPRRMGVVAALIIIRTMKTHTHTVLMVDRAIETWTITVKRKLARN